MNVDTSNFVVGIRKNVENDRLQYWLLIKAKAVPPGEDESRNVKFNRQSFVQLYIQLIKSFYWRIFIVITVMFNSLCFISYFWMGFDTGVSFILIVVALHLTCFFYWVDFVGAIVEKVFLRTNSRHTRSFVMLTVDAISLLPLSTIYLIIVRDTNVALLWQLRCITVLRFYRIPLFFSQLSGVERNHWNVLLASYAFYLIIFVIFYSNIFLCTVDQYSKVPIKDWDKSVKSKIIVSLYYSLEIILNVGFGDIEPTSYPQILMNAFAMAVGAAFSSGIFSGILGMAYTSKASKREYYRYEFEAMKNTLRERNIPKKMMRDTLDHMDLLWKWKRGYDEHHLVHILPLSLQKGIYFDINYGHLHKSLIFSTKPRSFLRSVSMFMKNVTYMPGDIIMEPPGISDVMICVASGVIEVLSDDNTECVLFSLTNGTILGEANLFLSLPIRCILRASTYVELQVLKKVQLARLALTYPDIFRAMRSDIYFRLDFQDQSSSYKLHSRRRRETAKFLTILKSMNRNLSDSERFFTTKNALLGLYKLSENIPRVKTLPLHLIRDRPWILRPHSTFTKVWNFLIVVIVIYSVILFPAMAAFVRKLHHWLYTLMTITKIFYIVDVCLQCTTAIERKDHFTYETSIKEIIFHRLKTVGFYLDVLAMYHLSIYAPLVWPDHEDYAYLLLSLNGLLKIWRVFSYIEKAQNRMRNNLLLIVTIKYVLCIMFVITWGSTLLYLEARPSDEYYKGRWYYEIYHNLDSEKLAPVSVNPTVVTFYFATVSIFALGYGDIAASSIVDCFVVSLVLVAGFILMIACVSEASAAIKHLAKIRTSYQEETVAVDQFMIEHDIPQEYRRRVRNYLRLQWEYDKGYSLKRISLRDSLPGFQRRIITIDLARTFLSVPLFRHADPEFLKVLANLCKVRVLPPNEQITIKGSFLREMYIIENGICQVLKEREGTNKKIIGPISAFGFVEMILGREQSLSVETLTHVRLVSLNYEDYLHAVTKHPDVKMDIDDALSPHSDLNQGTEDDFETDSKLGFTYVEETEEAQTINLNIHKQLHSKAFVNVYKYHKIIASSYWEPFDAWGRLRFFQFLLMPFTILPESLFLKIWMVVRIVQALLIGVLSPLQFSVPEEIDKFMKLIIALQVLNAIDMYLMFHVAYYDKRGLLHFHPADTSTNYLKGCFVLDLISVFPFYWLLKHLYPKADSTMKFFIKLSGMIMVLQLYKFFQGFYYLERDILRKTEVFKIVKMFPFVIIVINLITGLVFLLQCYKTHETQTQEFEGITRLAKEILQNTKKYCMRDDVRNKPLTPDDESHIFKMYLTTLYWVTTTITVCGFGDIAAFRQTTMIVVILILTLGIFFFCYVFATITSSMVNKNVVISEHRRQVSQMMLFMKRQQLRRHLQERFLLHYEYTWMRTEGGNPQKIFSCLHAALRERILSIMYDTILTKNPLFKDNEKAIISIIAKHLDELYFLQGETIVKYKDIQEDIYLIYRGEVHLLSQHEGLLTAMGSGGVFGNISNKSFSLSSVTVIASENVDLLRLDRKAFFAELQTLPTKNVMTEMTTNTLGYIKPVTGVSVLEPLGTPMKLNVYRIRLVPVERRSNASSYIYLISEFAFQNSIFYLRFKPCRTFVILPRTVLHNTIETCISAMAYISVLLNIYMFAFQEFCSSMIGTLYFMDIFFLFEIYLQLHMTQSDKYVKSKKLFYDIISNFPLEILAFTASRNWRMRLLSIFRLNRIIRLHYILTFYYKKKKELMTNKIYLEIGWILTLIVLLTHVMACIWFIGVCPLGFLQTPSWVTDMNLTGKKSWEFYIYCMYHVNVMMTSTGLQLIRVYSIPEVVLSMFFLITCRYCVVLLSGLMAATINADNLSLLSFQERIVQMKFNFSRQNVSAYQLNKMWTYLTTLWLRENGQQIPEFISTAPYTMKCEVMMEMFGRHLSESYIFSPTDPTFLRQLASHLKRYVFFPGNYIVQQGDIDYSMYFIHRGEVSVLTIHPELMETIHFTLTENDNFGMEQGLKIGKAHDFSYRAETNVEVLSLTLSDWQHLLKYFPEDSQKVYERVETLPKKDQ